ncbi:dTMP kinase [Paenibacillus beijingensis]|uniref:dTMP kinase n=1 Tax=Paenibacillus beijingensis TaxID=1126833 RepID=UPI000A6A47D0|nr:dTMP kinase [Paenibacillus beijingensis]
MNNGMLITIEGGEGAGKSSIIQALAAYLASKGVTAVTTREPGGIPIAEQIRNVILDPAHVGMDARTEALLYAAARRQHLVEKVIPALKEGRWVLCDRFIDSSLAYQGYARGLGMEEIMAINSFAIAETMPDLTLYLDVSPQTGLKRIAEAGVREVNRLDLETMTFHERVREGYRQLVRKFPQRIVQVDAEGAPEHVLNEATRAIERRFEGIFAAGVKKI